MRLHRMFKIYASAFAMLLLAAVCSLYFVGGTDSTVTKENVVRIKNGMANGMTKEEVIALLGKPDSVRFKGTLKPGTEAWNGGRDPFTASGEAMIHVEFDPNHHVIGLGWFPPDRDLVPEWPPPSLLERFIRWCNGE